MATNWSTMPVIGCLLAFNATWLILPKLKALMGKFIFPSPNKSLLNGS